MGGVRPNVRENGQIRPSTTVRAASGGGSRPRREPPLAKHRIFVKISASLGVIRGIPDHIFASCLAPISRSLRGSQAEAPGRGLLCVLALFTTGLGLMV
jgi:hypothetical protein